MHPTITMTPVTIAQITLQPRAGIAILMLAALVALFQLAEIEGLAPQKINVVGPLLLLAVLAFLSRRLVRDRPWMLFTPLVPFFAACGIYYGFGPLLYRFGNLATIEYVQSYFWLDEATLVQTNQLNAVCILFVCLAFAAALWLIPLPRLSSRLVFDDKMRDKFILICLLIGAPIRYFLVPLHNSGVLGFYIPSQVLAPGEFVLFSLMLMIWSVAAGQRKWAAVLVPLLGFEVLVRIAGANKYDFFLLFSAVVFGVYLARPRMQTLYAGVGAAVALWFFVYSASESIRADIFAGEDYTLVAGAKTALSALQMSDDSAADDAAQGSWARVCYAPAQGFCLRRYDAGYPGETIKLWYWSFLPRFLFPEKPEMTTGTMFNVLVTGNPQSKSAPGLFGEAYWNGGWPLAIGAATYVGALFALLTHIVPRCFLERDFRWLPIMWCGVVMGLRVDDWAVPTYLGSWPVAISTSLLLYLIFPSSSLARS